MLDVPSPGASALAASTNTQVRRRNRRAALYALRVHGRMSRAELARATGLTPQAIANIVDDLIAIGHVREAGRRKSPRGQPPIVLEIAGDGGYAIGVRIDSGSYHAVAADLSGEFIGLSEGETPTGKDVHWLDFIADVHSGFANRLGVERCLGLGLVTPGPFDIGWPGVLTPGAIPDLQSRSVAEELSALTHCEVFLENDAYAAALGEKLYGVARDLENFFYVYVGEGVGAGIVIRGKPYRGNRGNAGEFGHLIVDPNGPACYCGNRGCLGEYLSLGAMNRQLAKVRAAGADETAAMEEWTDRGAAALSVSLASIENLFDPEMVILGGAAPAELLERLIEKLGALRPSVRQEMAGRRLGLSTLGDRSAALGASALPILAAMLGEGPDS